MKTFILSTLFLATAFFSNAQLAGSGKAYDFTNNYLSVPNNALLNPGNITIEAWIKADSWATNIWENVIVSKDGWASGNQGYTLRAGANGSLSFNISIAGTWREVATSPVMTTGKWYHVAGSFDGTTMRVYVNGEELNTLAVTGTIANGTYDLNFGRIAYTVGGTRYFDGMIDEVKIWNSALPSSSIRAFMCKKVTGAHPQYANLIGYWKFDAVGSIVDSSPNGLDGTVVGPTHVNSGAPIGNESIFSYGVPALLTLPWGGIDSLQVSSTASLQNIHIYSVTGAPTNPVNVAGVTSDQTHFYGIYVGQNSAYSVDATYFYGSNPFVTAGNEQYLGLVGRANGNVSWVSDGGTLTQATDRIDKNYTNRREIVLAKICPPATVNLSGAQQICFGDTLTLNSTGTSSTLQWHNASGPIAGATSPTLSVTTSGNYYLVANGPGCQDTSSTIALTVNPLPVVNFASIPTDYCENGQNVTITGSTPSGGLYSGSGMSGNQFAPSTLATGNYTLYYTFLDVSTSCVNSDSLEVTVNAQPASPVITTVGSDICVPATPGYTYQWYFSGSPIPSATNECFTVSNNGNYSVVWTNALGCSSDPTAITINDASLSENAFDKNVTIHPNPVETTFEITIGKEITSSYDVFLIDALGKVIARKMEIFGSTNLNLDGFPAGIYTLKLTLTDGSIATRKVVKH